MTYRIGKRFTFEAAHCLVDLPATHKCSRLHGHSYSVALEVVGAGLDPDGFVIDYGDLDPFRHWIDDELDHRNLNLVLDLPTTAENIARQLYEAAENLLAPRLVAAGARLAWVEVSETAKTWSRYEP